MSKIELMKPELANLIAAGEVIERPASVVKELVENSIDAQSNNIYVGVKDGGIAKIIVRDDGCGMDDKDAEMCFLRHASSKIRSEFDLNRIHTLGFRGEAIPSIASVSKMILNTSDGESGTRVVSLPDRDLEISPGPLRRGTSFEVSDLFFNTPARLKYLRSPQVENSSTIEMVEHLSLGFPDIAFSLFIDDKEIFRTSGRGDLLEAIQKIYGNKLALSTYEVRGEGVGFSFTGYIAKPEVSYSKRYNMLIFINNRCIYDHKLQKAIEEAYKDYLPPQRYPFALIKMTIDSQLVDINVHPTKREVRISIENEIASELRTRISDVLGSKKPIYLASQDDRTSKSLGIERADLNFKAETPSADLSGVKTRPSSAEPRIVERQTLIQEPSFEPSSSHVPQEREEDFSSQISSTIRESETGSDRAFPSMHPIGQVLRTYIVCDGDDCFYLIDQHAAAERVNYERVQKRFRLDEDRKIPLFPIVIDISFKERQNYDDRHKKELEECGIFTELFGGKALKITEIPTFFDDKNIDSVLSDTVHSCLNDEISDPVELLHLTIANIACKMSIRANHLMSPQEMEGLIRELSRCENPANCPHGRPTIIRIDRDDIEKIFRRTGF